jgi:hypothetical protein
VLIVVVIAGVIVVVIIPVAVRMPTMAVFVPPPVCVRPAVLARFVQLLASVYYLSAFPSVVFGGFVKPMIGFCNAPLARRFIGLNRRCTHENESTCQCCCRKPRAYPK